MLIYLWRKQHKLAMDTIERAISLLPDARMLVWDKMTILNYVGRHAETIQMIEKGSDRLYGLLGQAYRLAGEHQKAEAALERAISGKFEIESDRFFPLLELAILYSEMNRIEEARAQAAILKQLWPDFSVEIWGQRIPYTDQAQIERDMASLRKAGLK